MGDLKYQRSPWDLARDQRGVITHDQLIALGYSRKAIKHRLGNGRLFRIYEGVYAVGRRELTQHGKWMAAVLASGETAVLSHESAAALWGLAKPSKTIHVSVLSQRRSHDDVVVHRRLALDASMRHGIPVTTPAQTLIDIASSPNIEQAIGEAVLKRLVSLKALRTAATKAGRNGALLRRVIERATFRVTQSELERALVRLLASAGLRLPESQKRFGRTRVDFYWPELQLVVETDGGRFHASAFQQLEDRRRDQAHIRAGRIPLRLTHWQVFHEPAETTALLVDVFTACECRLASGSTKRAA